VPRVHQGLYSDIHIPTTPTTPISPPDTRSDPASELNEELDVRLVLVPVADPETVADPVAFTDADAEADDPPSALLN
jgi:hypothetical protein